MSGMTEISVPPWRSWGRVTVALEGEPGVTLEDLYQLFKARLQAEHERSGLHLLRGEEREIAERMGL